MGPTTVNGLTNGNSHSTTAIRTQQQRISPNNSDLHLTQPRIQPNQYTPRFDNTPPIDNTAHRQPIQPNRGSNPANTHNSASTTHHLSTTLPIENTPPIDNTHHPVTIRSIHQRQITRRGGAGVQPNPTRWGRRGGCSADPTQHAEVEEEGRIPNPTAVIRAQRRRFEPNDGEANDRQT